MATTLPKYTPKDHSAGWCGGGDPTACHGSQGAILPPLDVQSVADHVCVRPYWVFETVLCGMPLPCCENVIKLLVQSNVGMVVSLIEPFEAPMLDEWIRLAEGQLSHFRLPIRDHTVPTMAQIGRFLSELRRQVEQGKAVAVHCLRGCGRTAVMLASYLVVERSLHPEEAIDRIKRLQPEAFSTLQQELFVWDMWKMRSELRVEVAGGDGWATAPSF